MFTLNTPNGGITFAIIHDGRLIEVITTTETSAVRMIDTKEPGKNLINMSVDAINEVLNNGNKATITFRRDGIFNGIYKSLEINLIIDDDNFSLTVFHAHYTEKDNITGTQEFMKLDNLCNFIQRWFFDDEATPDTLLATLMR